MKHRKDLEDEYKKEEERRESQTLQANKKRVVRRSKSKSKSPAPQAMKSAASESERPDASSEVEKKRSSGVRPDPDEVGITEIVVKKEEMARTNSVWPPS